MSKYSFNLVDKMRPELVIKKALEQFDADTNGYVIGNIASYSGFITSYVRKTGYVLNIQNMLGGEEEIDIQQDLGAQNEDSYKFEVFLTVKGIENYKYRLMFLKYGTISYPATVVLNEDLAEQCFDQKKPTVMLVDSMAETDELIQQIMNSDYFENIVQKLIFEALRQEEIEKEKVVPPEPIGKVSQ